MGAIKALTFDTGGTIPDWRTGFRTALATVGARRGLAHDWSDLANELRRRSLVECCASARWSRLPATSMTRIAPCWTSG